jgi:pimeloyl-ACP methyl ester carboxylesterase
MDELIAAYRATGYRVVDAAGAVLAEARIGHPSPTVDRLLATHGAGGGVFITAWNPRSIVQAEARNEAAHDRLLGHLRGHGRRFLPHVGVGADPAWSEHGVFVLDLATDEALAVAVAYGQNAIVIVQKGRPAELVTTELLGG